MHEVIVANEMSYAKDRVEIDGAKGLGEMNGAEDLVEMSEAKDPIGNVAKILC